MREMMLWGLTEMVGWAAPSMRVNDVILKPENDAAYSRSQPLILMVQVV